MTVLVPGGSAADIRVTPSDYRVAETHPRDHLIARFTFQKQGKHI